MNQPVAKLFPDVRAWFAGKIGSKPDGFGTGGVRRHQTFRRDLASMNTLQYASENRVPRCQIGNQRQEARKTGRYCEK